MGLLSKRATVSPDTRVKFRGEDILKYSRDKRRLLRGSRISMIFQEPMSSLNPLYSIGTQIAEAIRAHRRSASRRRASRPSPFWPKCASLIRNSGSTNIPTSYPAGNASA